MLYSSYTHLYSYVCLTYCMHGLCTCILHNSETLEPLTWIRVRPSHRYAHTLSLSFSLPLSLAHTCVVSCLLNISKYTTFKPITRLVLSYTNLATYLTLMVSIFLTMKATIFDTHGSTDILFNEEQMELLLILIMLERQTEQILILLFLMLRSVSCI